ncbi:MAG: FAD-dependent oxidoreductase [Parabacteroides sp.]|nr:FAD-dependent oxidoreductase [Parabacteroides sp.]
MDQMGSSYLMAHGMGQPVEDAITEVSFGKTGVYHVFVRTYNWTSPWYKGNGPGKFQLKLNNETLSAVLGCEGNRWMWQKAGTITIKDKKNKISLHDLSGFNGRCDAIYFTMNENDIPPAEKNALSEVRKQKLNLPKKPTGVHAYDFVVVGGGIAGMSAAIAAARLGCKVALVHDRPVLGGNNSSEVRVHLGGRIEAGLYPALGALQKEFGPVKGGNAQPESFYEDEKKMEAVKNEKNITLYASCRAFDAEMEGNRISKVFIRNIETNREMALVAPLFADCTGDANLGFMVKAEYRSGREARSEYNEETAPLQADGMTMGASVQWYATEDSQASTFPPFSYGMTFDEKSSEKVVMGEWTWETGMNKDQVDEAEYIRDYGLLVVFSNWSFLKNFYSLKNEYADYSLKWVAYIAGKRESRRLTGDYVLTENDLVNFVEYPHIFVSI